MKELTEFWFECNRGHEFIVECSPDPPEGCTCHVEGCPAPAWPVREITFHDDMIRRGGLAADVMGLIHALAYDHEGRDREEYKRQAQEILKREWTDSDEINQLKLKINALYSSEDEAETRARREALLEAAEEVFFMGSAADRVICSGISKWLREKAASLTTPLGLSSKDTAEK